MQNKKILLIVGNDKDTADTEHKLKSMNYVPHVIGGVDKALKNELDIMPEYYFNRYIL
jgi:hypothetical protein